MIECTICCGARTRQYCRKEAAIYYVCSNCGVIFQHPAPPPEAMVSYADTEYEGGLYREYVEARDMKLDHFRTRMKRLSSRVRKGRLLDVGCSCGYFLEVAAAAGFDVYGLEFSKAAIRAANPAIRSRILCSGIESLNSEGEYDLITAFDLIEHLGRPKEFLRKSKQLLAPGGILALATPDAEHLLRYVMRSRWPMLQPMQHLTIFSHRALRIALEEVGFTQVSIEPATKTLSYEYLVNQLRILTPTLHAGFRALGRVLPAGMTRKYRHVNIGEFMAIATWGEGEEPAQ